MKSRVLSLFIFLLIFLLTPLSIRFLLSKPNDQAHLAKVKEPFKVRYEHASVDMYSLAGQLDYRLKARQLFLQDDKLMKVEMPNVTVASFHGMPALRRPDLGEGSLNILSDRAILSNNRLHFLDHVKMKAQICTLKRADCALPILVKSNQLEYRLKDQFFSADGDVFYCRGVQEVSARRVFGQIDDQDFTFNHAKIVYKKHSSCF